MEEFTPMKAFKYTVAIGTALHLVSRVPLVLDAITCMVAKRKFPEVYEHAKNKTINKN